MTNISLDCKFLLLLIFLSWITFARSSDFFINGTFFDSINSPSIRLDDTRFNVSGRVVLADPVHGCSELKNPDSELEGSILLITSDTGLVACRLYQRIQRAYNRGCIGLIFENKAYGGGAGFVAYYINWDVQRHNLKIPAVEIPESAALIKKLKDSQNVVTVVMENGANQISDTAGAWIALSVIMGSWSLFCTASAAYKLKLFIERYGVQYSVPQICLVLLFLSALLRVCSMVDPPFVRGIYPWFINGLLDLMNYPLSLCAALLMAFYWEDAMKSASVHSIPMLQKMKKQFYTSAVLLMLLVCLTVILRGFNTLLNLLDFLSAIITLVFSSCILVFYSWESYQVLSRLYGSKSITKKQSSLYKMTLLLVSSACFMFVYVVFIIMLAATPFQIQRFVAIRFMLTGSMCAVNTLQILAFQKPGSIHSTNSSGSNYSAPRKSAAETAKDFELAEGGPQSTEPSMENV